MKRIIALCLCVLLCLGTVSCDKAERSVLKIGAEGVGGALYPFEIGTAGDEAVKDVIYTRLVSFDESGNIFCGEESCAVSESVRVYAADSTFAETEEPSEDSLTAFEFTLKNGVRFSDGSEMTAEDVLFSLYCAFDNEIGSASAGQLSVVGLDNYLYQSEDASAYLKLAYDILEKGEAYVPGEEDSFSEEESRIFWDAFHSCGKNFVSNIISYVSATYCTDELVSSYIFDGYSAQQVKNSTALTNSYAMRLWNYGNYTYSYVPDENGIYVASPETNGTYTYKTTLEKALESEAYTEYAESENGLYVYDKVATEYRLYEEGDTGKRYDRVLSSKYTVVSRYSLTGFRDLTGKLYTLEGEDYPKIEEFFSLMCITYTKDGIIDYRRLESIEAASDGDSFVEDASESFAAACVGEHGVEKIEGIVHSQSGDIHTVTVFIEGLKWENIYSLDIPIVSKKYYTEGYTVPENSVVSYGVPLADYNFRHHIESLSPMSAGAYCFEAVSADKKTVTLAENEYFSTVSEQYVSSFGYEAVEFIDASAVTDLSEVDIALWDVGYDGELLEKGELFFSKSFSYDYVLINPSHYININTRRALLSLMDTSVATEGKADKEMTCCMPSFMWTSAERSGYTVFDESGESAKAYFEAAGYVYSESGELIDPVTKQKAVFRLTLLPSAADTPVCRTFEKAAQLLVSLGADASVVFDEDLLYNIYGEGGVGIYSLGWETVKSNSLYERYAVSSESDSVKASGFSFLADGGQLDNFGTVTFYNDDGESLEYSQADATLILDELIRLGDKSVSFEEKKTAYDKALALINELAVEMPLCQRGSYVYVNSETVDVSTVNREPTEFASVISGLWRINKTETGTDSEK